MRKASGVIAVYKGKICIIKATGKGWTIPKGGVGKLTKKDGAVKEAYEEAGLIGTVREKLGQAVFVKGGEIQQVHIFRMNVSALADNYPEQHRRRRKFVDIGEAREKLPTYYHEALNGLV